MNLEGFKGTERIYIDSTIFVSHHSKDAIDRKECTAFLNAVEKGEMNAVTSSIAIDETAYILLKFKAAEILNTDRHYKILASLRHDKDVFDEAWEVAQIHIDFVDALRAKNVLQIITETADPLEIAGLAKRYQLLPRDASHLGIMRKNMIKNIATNDSDFERIKDIEMWRP
ncbi:putative nucleic acid-binding protein, contains PIN domain [Candidatus Methanoperedens nitroreducens]|uniref:Putative nucleic acid-binding protein, contains PIN domain n=1 Tax=Candidatus Methanoperedens nitratireducens TaxID=1392998 RepID=A0A062V234_9EURY|nr:type II toxin-antitoxin system VapC family toxin [Candidatus Methanoperedens nitroreducens]KCZ73171.1 putative nucleic acid-binding protein, contains PIN domain [Candidatus Methanoperedens nitroreducens]MDJ1422880.1 type II toxin-antitoxin system VapC family toxin [Candidatus Methanoperedens sp.]